MDERATRFNILPNEMLEKIFLLCDISSIKNIRKLGIDRVNCVVGVDNKLFWKKKFRFDYHNYIRNKYFRPVLYVMDNMYDSYIYTVNKVPPCLKAEEYFIVNTLNKILKPEIDSRSTCYPHPNVMPAVLQLPSAHQPSTLACYLVRSIIACNIDINEISISPRLIDYIYTECIQYKDTAYRNDWIVLPKTHDYIFKNRLIDFIYKLDKNLHTDVFSTAFIEWEQMSENN